MEFLQNLLHSSQIPFVTAFILGLLTAISPCPLATNIAAIGYIGQDITHKKSIFINGLIYTLGRLVAYALLGIILISILRRGAETFSIQKAVSKWGELIFPPFLIIMGVLMLFTDKINLPGLRPASGQRVENLKGTWGSLLLGILFALTFCPSSALFYFGMLIPLSATTQGGYWLPAVFAVATSLPVIVVAWLLAYSISGIGKFYNKIKTIQKWFTFIVAALLILIGIYYTLLNYNLL